MEDDVNFLPSSGRTLFDLRRGRARPPRPPPRRRPHPHRAIREDAPKKDQTAAASSSPSSEICPTMEEDVNSLTEARHASLYPSSRNMKEDICPTMEEDVSFIAPARAVPRRVRLRIDARDRNARRAMKKDINFQTEARHASLYPSSRISEGDICPTMEEDGSFIAPARAIPRRVCLKIDARDRNARRAMKKDICAIARRHLAIARRHRAIALRRRRPNRAIREDNEDLRTQSRDADLRIQALQMQHRYSTLREAICPTTEEYDLLTEARHALYRSSGTMEEDICPTMEEDVNYRTQARRASHYRWTIKEDICPTMEEDVSFIAPARSIPRRRARLSIDLRGRLSICLRARRARRAMKKDICPTMEEGVNFLTEARHASLYRSSRTMEEDANKLAEKPSASYQSDDQKIDSVPENGIPQTLYVYVASALGVENQLEELNTHASEKGLTPEKYLSQENRLLGELARDMKEIDTLAEHYKKRGILHSDWKYDLDTASTCVPVNFPLPAKKEPMKNIPRNPHIDRRRLVGKLEKAPWRDFKKFDNKSNTTTHIGLPFPLDEKFLTTVDEKDTKFVSCIRDFAVKVFNDSCQMYRNTKAKNKNVSNAKVEDCKYIKVLEAYIFYMYIQALEQGKTEVYRIIVTCNLTNGAIVLDKFCRTPEPSGMKEGDFTSLEFIYETVEGDTTTDPELSYELSGLVRRNKGGYDFYNPCGRYSLDEWED